ncbi:MAG: AAA family ATPase [Azoarcus sp.]|jgi:DNA transposition AAA+ family ATPase|nr:AAA family ATPase [Azoarcus sp.]
MNAPVTPVFPAHYSAADTKQITGITRWMQENRYSQAALARLARISASSLNQIIHGSYATSPAKLLASVASALKNADAASGRAMPAVETSVFRLIHIGCDMARNYRNFAVLSGYVGTGKTFAIKHYALTRPNTHIIEASPTMTPQSLVKQLARAVMGLEKGSIADKFDQIVASLRDTDSLLIVDEAETLTPHQLHTIRRVRDLANIGVVLTGTEHLSGLIRPQHGQFDQIRSRTGFWPETLRGITPDDAAALTQAAFGAEDVPEDVVARLHAYSRGSARMLVEGLVAGIKKFREDRGLDVKLVDAVAKQALCLQSLA